MPTARLFLGLFPDASVRQDLAAWRDAWTWPRSATPVKTVRLHQTLHFIGDVERERIPELTQALSVPFDAFLVRYGRAALWPHGVAVLEPHDVPQAMLALHAALAGALDGARLMGDDRAYRPHVTMARRAVGALAPGDGPAITWPIDRYALMESTLGADGGYTMLEQYPALR